MMPGCDFQQGFECNTTSKTCQLDPHTAAGMVCGALASGDVVSCGAGGQCVIPTGATTGSCVAPAADGAACDTLVGPPCLSPAKCVTSGTSTSGTCQIADATKC